MKLDPAVERRPHPDGELLWSPITGRGAVFSPGSLDRDTPTMRARLVELGLLDAPSVDDRVVCRSKLPLLLPDRPALWHPVPSARTAGGYGWTALPLTPLQLAAWEAANDARTLRELAARLGSDPAALHRALAPLLAFEVQALQLRPRPPQRGDPGLQRLVSAPRPDNARVASQHDGAGGTALLAWHVHEIVDGSTHFDDRETTVAHAHALPHAGLGGRRFGAALGDALVHRGMVPSQGVLAEVGCGTGELARDLVTRLPAALRYLRVDLSPALLRTQAENAPTTAGILGDATRLPLRGAAVDLLVSNEVLADLPAVLPAGADATPTREQVALSAFRERFALDPLPEGVRYNVGAMALVAECARVLRPGGAAYLSEFGDDAEIPTETRQLDHPEVSIRFGHLVAVARGLGLHAELVRLDHLLGADLSAPQVTRGSFEGARALARSQGVHLPARAYTAAELASLLPERVVGLVDGRLSDPGPGPLITRFTALLLRRAP